MTGEMKPRERRHRTSFKQGRGKQAGSYHAGFPSFLPSFLRSTASTTKTDCGMSIHLWEGLHRLHIWTVLPGPETSIGDSMRGRLLVNWIPSYRQYQVYKFASKNLHHEWFTGLLSFICCPKSTFPIQICHSKDRKLNHNYVSVQDQC